MKKKQVNSGQNHIYIGGNVSNSQFQIGTTHSSQITENYFDYEKAKEQLDQIQEITKSEKFRSNNPNKIDELDAICEELQSNILTKQPSNIIVNGFLSIKSILESVGANLLSSGITHYLSTL